MIKILRFPFILLGGALLLISGFFLWIGGVIKLKEM